MLSKLNLARGPPTPITTMLNYVLIGFPPDRPLHMIWAIQWDKLQWVAGGLSVGNGFGMKEILSNFVRHLSRTVPGVRCGSGDAVTIGSFRYCLGGSRIRATTPTDFLTARRLIIPNQWLMTERLINWSLSMTPSPG